MRRTTSKRSDPAQAVPSEPDRDLESTDIISAAELRLIALGEPPPVINRCELRQLPWHCIGRASFQRQRQVEPHRLTYAARCGTESVITAPWGVGLRRNEP